MILFIYRLLMALLYVAARLVGFFFQKRFFFRKELGFI